MKNLLLCLFASILLFSCSKSDKYDLPEQPKEWYRVSAIGTDTARTSWMQARTETVGIVIAEDNLLKAELMSFTPMPGNMGLYTVKITSKLSCQGILRWNWEGLGLDIIQPNDSTANTPQSDVMKAGHVKTFLITGDAKVGKIKVKIQSDCGNSSTLIIPITMQVLPITFLESRTTKDKKTGKVTVSFSIDDPSIVDWYLIEKMVDSNATQAALISSDKVTKSFTVKL